jgi:hypothetical protein
MLRICFKEAVLILLKFFIWNIYFTRKDSYSHESPLKNNMDVIKNLWLTLSREFFL